MRCPDCNRMVSYGDPTVEVNDEDISSQKEEGKNEFSGEVTCNVRLVLPCRECSTELKETNFEFTLPFEHKCKEGTEITDEDEGEDFSMEVEAEPTDRFQTTNPKTGKPIPHRFQKHFYGTDVRADITCPHCREEFDVTGNEECQASSMDELV